MWDIIINNIPLVILLILAIVICGADLIKAIKVWKDASKEKYDKERCKNDELKEIKDLLNKMVEKQSGLDNTLETMQQQIKDLTISDMHDIKSWIVEQYHKFYTVQGWIDAFNAETIDRRYEDYKKEGGNSYIDTLMERIHTLPMDPDQEQKNKK